MLLLKMGLLKKWRQIYDIYFIEDTCMVRQRESRAMDKGWIDSEVYRVWDCVLNGKKNV